MTVHRRLTLAVSVCLILSTKFGTTRGERWSRQVSNSEWIPLANPRSLQAQVEQTGPSTGRLASGSAQLPQLPQLSLPPALQQQYQEQLLQLQKTQENIQKLLLLQQQLRAQQQLLQSQTFVPSGFSNAGNDEDKQLHQVRLGDSQVADLASEDLVPPLPLAESLPSVFPPQNFLPQRPNPATKQDTSLPQELANLSGQDFKNEQLLQQRPNVGNVGQIEGNQRQGAKQIKEPNQVGLVSQSEGGQDEEEEVQLVYVPAETLAQRGQPKRGHGRKQYHSLRQHKQPQQQSQGVDAIGHDQNAFARQILQQIQMEREEKAQFLKEERMKEIARLNEEQRALERKARLQQEALQREQELQRQREAEKKKKELERLEELAKQRELERIREAREKQRLEELERRRLAEVRAKEEKRRAEEANRQREAERLAALERQKELEIQRQRERENEESRVEQPENRDVQAQALPLIRNQNQQLHRQQLSETPKQGKSKTRGRQRQRPNFQDQQSYREASTTPSPNQPPLSVYMGSPSSKTTNVKVSDVLRILKDAKTIAVLDTVGPDTPQVFVGPTSLDPPPGYAKFDLPYLSSIDHNRVERRVDKLPFFVAPLSFDPPTGYSKIPFPAPHIGSVVVNTLDNTLDPTKDRDDPNPSPTPLIEPNSYLDGLDAVSDSTTPSYEPQTTITYPEQPSSTPKYEQTYSTPSVGYSSGSRFRFRQFYADGKPASVIGTSYYDEQKAATRKDKYYIDEGSRTTEIPAQSGNVGSVGRAEEVSYSTTPAFKEETMAGHQEPSDQLALINEQLAQQREKYNNGGQYGEHKVSGGQAGSLNGEIASGDVNDVRDSVGPTQYSLPAELPAISPHLPGLVNSLLDKNEAKLYTTSTTTSTTTTTTTTQRIPTTTYRPRSRQRSRLVSTRPRTTTETTPSSRTNVDRNRRPYNRSRSRFTTTTEEYHESAYEPTRSKIPETTVRYNGEHRRPTSRTHKYRNRDKISQQSEVQNKQTQQTYDTISHSDSNLPTSNGFLQQTGPDSSNLRHFDSSSNLNDYTPENYPSTTVSTTENYPSFHEVTVNHGSALISEDYSRSQSYPQPIQEHYRSTVEQVGIEKSPVNGFNYQAQSGEPLDQRLLERTKDYQLDGKVENGYEVSTTVDPTRLRTSEEQRYSSVYDASVPQTQPEYSLTGQDNLHHAENEKIQTGVIDSNPNEQPIFIPLPENKQEDYELSLSSTELPLLDITTDTPTTSTTPVIIRQRVRGRIGTRLHHEPSVQTRNKGSQDEYVRFNVVNDSSRTISGRQRTRSRPRTPSHGSQVQTDGNEYIKIHALQQQRLVATTTPPPSTTTTTVSSTEEDIDYGFIRPPNFRPVHPVDNRFQQAITYRPHFSEVPQQSLLLNEDETALESSPPHSQLLKNRQKYQPTPNRRPSTKATTVPPSTTTMEAVTTTEKIPVATVLPDDMIYTVKSKSRPDEAKEIRVRGRIRRPGRKRVTTTSTTESVLEAHNELPLDENYPPIRPQAVTTEHQQTVYSDNYNNNGGFSDGARNPTGQQFYETSSENYPPEFILNFGNDPSQPVQRDEYDQAQLGSDAARKYGQASRPSTSAVDNRRTTADIYGAESQWSTKLTRTSFQPSFSINQVSSGEASKVSQAWSNDGSSKNVDLPEIITAPPEPSSVTLIVSSDDKRVEEEEKKEEEEEDESTLMGTTMFGMKTQDHTERTNSTASIDAAAMEEKRSGVDAETMENSTKQLMTSMDLERVGWKRENSTGVKKISRRRKVRVRVRPAADDFVTAESQHFNSALNGLFRDQHKYDRQSKPFASPQKSIARPLITDILKNDEPTEAAWTVHPTTTTTTPIEHAEETTEIQIATIPTASKPEETTRFDDLFVKMAKKPQDAGKMKEEKKERKKEVEGETETWEWSKKWNQKTVENAVNFVAGKYRGKEMDGNDTLNELSRELAEKLAANQKEAKRKNDIMESASESGEEGRELLRNENFNHPKNHRVKWSEVRYPSAFEQSKASNWKHDSGKTKSGTPSIPGLVTRNEGDTSVNALSDYVQAIFDTMKSAEEGTNTATNTESTDEITTTVLPPSNTLHLPDRVDRSNGEKLAMKDDDEATTRAIFEEVDGNEATEPTANADATTTISGRIDAISNDAATSSSAENNSTTVPPLSASLNPALSSNSTESILGKVLRTSTTTKVSHMTEICYRGRCVMTRPSRDDRFR